MRILDVFSGAGGLSFGFAKSDFFRIIAANDIERNVLESYVLNHKETRILESDVAELGEAMLKSLGGIDLLLGGPPCQSYSTLGKRKMDNRANLFKEYLRILRVLRPRCFVFENVVGLLSMNGDRLFREICTGFESLGYAVYHKILNAAEFGVPQIRQRLIVVGIRNDFKEVFCFPKPTHFEDKGEFVSIKDALDDLPRIKSGESGDGLGFQFAPNNAFLKFVRTSKHLKEHTSPKNNLRLVEIMQTLQDGQGKDDLPPNLRPKSGYCNTYAKMFWHKPAPTITRNFATPSSSRCIHPRDSRALSIREGARLQSFPDDYEFYGSNSDRRLQIGNAVPPLLSIALASNIEQYFRR